MTIYPPNNHRPSQNEEYFHYSCPYCQSISSTPEETIALLSVGVGKWQLRPVKFALSHVCINKILLEWRHIHFLMYLYCWFYSTSANLSDWDRHNLTLGKSVFSGFLSVSQRLSLLNNGNPVPSRSKMAPFLP